MLELFGIFFEKNLSGVENPHLLSHMPSSLKGDDLDAGAAFIYSLDLEGEDFPENLMIH